MSSQMNNNQLFNFVSSTNGTGDSIYDLYRDTVDKDATAEQFLEAMRGEDGYQGKDGKSAYEIWLEVDGNEGKSEEEFIDSLKGEKGEKGETGPQGEPASENLSELNNDAGFITNTVDNLVNYIPKTEVESALEEKVPTTRTINGKVLSEDITLTPEDIGVDNTAVEQAKAYTDTKMTEEVTARDEAIAIAKSEAISTAALDATTKADNTLVDAKSYTDTEIDKVIEDYTNITNDLSNNKVDKVDGKDLSTNDFTNEEKAKLAGIAEGANNYVLPSAGSSLGGVKTGGDVTISDGVITVNDDSHNHTISNIDGLESALSTMVASTTTINGKSLESNIALTADDVGADNSGSANAALVEMKEYVDTKFDEVMGEGASETLNTIGEISKAFEEHKEVTEAINAAIGEKADTSTVTAHTSDTNVHITSTERNNWNDANSKKHSHTNKTVLDNTTASYTTEEKSKLAGIAAGAEVNQNAFSNVVIGSTTIAADAKTDTLTLVAGDNITLTPDATNDKITVAAKDTVYTHPSYTAKTSGLYKVAVDNTGHVSGTTAVTKADITALGIPAQDTVYTHPAYTAKSSGLYKIIVDATGHVSAATAVAKADITALGIPAQDTVYTHPAYTARTGKPTANQTPAFGGTATVTQVTSDATGHVTAMTDRTITIPATLSNGTGTAGLIKTTSTVTSTSGLTACPVINGVPYYKDTNALTLSSITGTLAINKGGTGATDAVTARANLGLGSAAAKSSTTSITNGSGDLITSGAVYTGLASKLNTSAVVTSLDSTSTTNALAASAGKNLQDQITVLDSYLKNKIELFTLEINTGAQSTSGIGRPISRYFSLGRVVPLYTLFFIQYSHNKDWVIWNFVATSSSTGSTTTRDSVWLNVTNYYSEDLDGTLYITGLIIN